MSLYLSEKKKGNEVIQTVSKPDIKMTKAKKKRDWVGIVHKGCRICMFRTIEAVIVFFVVSLITLAIGNFLIPSLAFGFADSMGITQGVDFYTASALWLFPMLFFCLLITSASFCILRKFIIKTHNYYSNVIRKGNEKDDMRKGISE